THRMGGGKVTSAQEPIVAHWMNAIPRVPVRTDLDGAKVAAGKMVFEGAGGCTSCHVGGTGTLAMNQDIGKVDSLDQSRPMQVPSLLDVIDRAPYMHDGCAATLMDRFNPACGGSNHGNVSSLSPTDVDDVTTYLESL
ncbi:MAG TPA: cytochrome-c peroxidase, partial [Polyangiaceae bacterium]